MKSQHELTPRILGVPEGPYIQLLGNQASKYHTIEGIMSPNTLMVVYVDPLGVFLCFIGMLCC